MVSMTFCTDEWKEHYSNLGQSVNSKLWDSIKSIEQYSQFVKYAEEYRFDAYIESSHTKTLFIPDNDAFDSFLNNMVEQDSVKIKQVLSYHISPTLFMIKSVEENRKLQTLNGKYVLIENYQNSYTYNGHDIIRESSLFADGKYYQISQVADPNPSLYEYLLLFSPAIHNYIDSRDTIILNKEESEPLGYNKDGEIIYDSVTTVENLYEQEYFGISEEYRNLSATLIIPDEESYNSALFEMAKNLGSNFQTHDDIPVKWQNSNLIPILLNKGTYGGILDYTDFPVNEKIANIKGDSILIDFEIDPNSRVTCSNGIVYNYSSFSIGDSLYLENKIEGEILCDEIGVSRYAWNDNAQIEHDESFQPKKTKVKSASNDSMLIVDFTNKYEGKYNISFVLKNVFPLEYRLVWRTNYRNPGEYAIYVNGERVLLGYNESETYDTYELSSGFFSVLGYRLYPDSKGFCTVDGIVDSLTEFGDVTITFEYLGPGQSSTVGFSMDYFELVTINE